MILEKIEVEQFGGLKHYELELGPGFHYLYGRNEAGKSTLCAFLSAMFYGLPAKTRGGGLRGDSRRLYMPWGESYMAGTLYFSDKGKGYVLKRRFGQTARGDTCTLFSSADWQEIPINKEEIGLRFLGVGEDAFRKTLYISQLGAAFEKGKEDELVTRLSNLERTGDESASIQKALAELERAQRELVSKTGRGGAISQLDTEIEALKTELLEARQRHLAFQDILEEIRLLTMQKNEADKKLAELRDRLSEAKAYEQYAARQRDRQKRSDAKKSLEATAAALLKIKEEQRIADEEKRDLQPIMALEQDILLRLAEQEAECRVLARKAEEEAALDRRIKELEAEIAACEEATGRGRVWLFAPAVAVFALAVALGLLLAPALYGLGAVSAALAIAAYLGARSGKKVKRQKEIIQAGLAEKQSALSRLREECVNEKLKKIREDMQAVFDAAETDSIEGLSAKIEVCRRLAHRIEDLDKEVARLSESVKTLTEQYQALPDWAEEEPLFYDGPPPEALEDLLEQTRQAQMEQERRLTQQSARAESGFSGARSVAVIESELSRKMQRRKELSFSYEAVTLAKNLMEACGEELKRGFTPALNARSGALIDRLTGGRYREVRIADDYTMMLKTPSGHEIIESDYVSAGTCDLIYFALRLAVLHTLFETIPLLLLDDAFILLDEARQKAAFALLSEESAEQILYFSCQEPAKGQNSGRTIKISRPESA